MDRQRLTITLRKDLLQQLDNIIDRVKIRNRSHAIEYLLSQSLAPEITQAVILAGGQGVQMRPLTYEVPKPLISVGGKPVIEYTLELLREAGIREVILAIGYLGDKLKQEIGNGRKFGMKIIYSEEKHALGSAGAIKNAYQFIQQKPFLVINGDILVKINLKEIIQFHQEDKCLGTMALSVKAETNGYGTVHLRGEKIVKFIKKSSTKASQLVNAGIYIFNPEIFNYIPVRGKADLDEDVFPKLVQDDKLAGFTFEGDWFEVSTPKNYELAIKKWKG